MCISILLADRRDASLPTVGRMVKARSECWGLSIRMETTNPSHSAEAEESPSPTAARRPPAAVVLFAGGGRPSSQESCCCKRAEESSQSHNSRTGKPRGIGEFAQGCKFAFLRIPGGPLLQADIRQVKPFNYCFSADIPE